MYRIIATAQKVIIRYNLPYILEPGEISDPEIERVHTRQVTRELN